MPTAGLAIIADDLTGALDAAALFAGPGRLVVVATAPDAMAQALATGAPVVAVSTRSRELAASEARARVAGVLAAVPAGMRIVKKIDSRLKGNIAPELEPFAGRPMVVLPAIPDFGRVVQDGALGGFGVADRMMVRDRLGRFAASASVPDVTNQAEMLAAVTAAPADAVLVGARGLAQALAASMGLEPQRPTGPLPAPVCFVVGSTDPITLSQVAQLRAAEPELAYIAAPSGMIPSDRSDPLGRRVTLIQATPGPSRPADQVARDFAAHVARCLTGVESLLLTGGCTAEAVLDMLGVACLEVAGEALPGMACCRAAGRVVVTKSGGFGRPDAFVRLVRQPAITGV